MPPRKKKAGIAELIGKSITMESRYDDRPLTGKLVSTDEDYLGVEIEDRVYYFSKQVIRGLTETVVPSELS
jgi:hypothetical protein